MCTTPHYASDLLLSRTILDCLNALPGSALRIYIFLASRNPGSAFIVHRKEILAGTGLRERVVYSGLKLLEEKNLIIREARSKSCSNTYRILFEPAEETHLAQSKPHGEGCAPQTTASKMPEMTTATNATKITKDVSARPTPSGVPTTTTRQLIALRYREVTDGEMAEIEQVFPDPIQLRERLIAFPGVDRHLALGFFLHVLERYCPATGKVVQRIVGSTPPSDKMEPVVQPRA